MSLSTENSSAGAGTLSRLLASSAPGNGAGGASSGAPVGLVESAALPAAAQQVPQIAEHVLEATEHVVMLPPVVAAAGVAGPPAVGGAEVEVTLPSSPAASVDHIDPSGKMPAFVAQSLSAPSGHGCPRFEALQSFLREAAAGIKELECRPLHELMEATEFQRQLLTDSGREGLTRLASRVRAVLDSCPQWLPTAVLEKGDAETVRVFNYRARSYLQWWETFVAPLPQLVPVVQRGGWYDDRRGHPRAPSVALADYVQPFGPPTHANLGSWPGGADYHGLAWRDGDSIPDSASSSASMVAVRGLQQDFAVFMAAQTAQLAAQAAAQTAAQAATEAKLVALMASVAAGNPQQTPPPMVATPGSGMGGGQTPAGQGGASNAHRQPPLPPRRPQHAQPQGHLGVEPFPRLSVVCCRPGAKRSWTGRAPASRGRRLQSYHACRQRGGRLWGEGRARLERRRVIRGVTAVRVTTGRVTTSRVAGMKICGGACRTRCNQNTACLRACAIRI